MTMRTSEKPSVGDDHATVDGSANHADALEQAPWRPTLWRQGLLAEGKRLRKDTPDDRGGVDKNGETRKSVRRQPGDLKQGRLTGGKSEQETPLSHLIDSATNASDKARLKCLEDIHLQMQQWVAAACALHRLDVRERPEASASKTSNAAPVADEGAAGKIKSSASIDEKATTMDGGLEQDNNHGAQRYTALFGKGAAVDIALLDEALLAGPLTQEMPDNRVSAEAWALPRAALSLAQQQAAGVFGDLWKAGWPDDHGANALGFDFTKTDDVWAWNHLWDRAESVWGPVDGFMLLSMAQLLRTFASGKRGQAPVQRKSVDVMLNRLSVWWQQASEAGTIPSIHDTGHRLDESLQEPHWWLDLATCLHAWGWLKNALADGRVQVPSTFWRALESSIEKEREAWLAGAFANVARKSPYESSEWRRTRAVVEAFWLARARECSPDGVSTESGGGEVKVKETRGKAVPKKDLRAF